jgi:hypothetical protein
LGNRLNLAWGLNLKMARPLRRPNNLQDSFIKLFAWDLREATTRIQIELHSWTSFGFSSAGN